MNIVFHNAFQMIISDGVSEHPLNIEKNVMYKIIKHSTKDNIHTFIFEFHGKKYRGQYSNNDFEVFGVGDVEDTQDELVSSNNVPFKDLKALEVKELDDKTKMEVLKNGPGNIGKDIKKGKWNRK